MRNTSVFLLMLNSPGTIQYFNNFGEIMTTTRDPIDKLLSGRMDRRSFHKMLAGLGLGLAAGPMMSRSALAAEEEANYFTWSGYEIPEFHQSYLKKNGKSPTSSFFGGSSEGMKKILAGFKS
jgi:spermidine/putrescine transport system substrate-binding protein